MNITCAKSVLLGQEIFSTVGNCKIIPDREINSSNLEKSDALIIRSNTPVDKSMLENTSLKFIGTATSGRDHIDIDLLSKKNIHLFVASGCNAKSVAEYVIASLLHLSREHDINLNNKNMAVIGCGNVGSAVCKKSKALGVNILKNDPPLQGKFPNQNYLPLKEILPVSDIVTVHVPFVKNGKWPTNYLVNKDFLKLMKPGSIFINSSRGQICDENALISILEEKRLLSTVLDVWSGEPDLNTDLYDHVSIATPHIAGHSFNAKLKGTLDCYNSLCDFFSVKNKLESFKELKTSTKNIQINANDYASDQLILNKIVKMNYDILLDHEIFKKNILEKNSISEAFTFFRKNYTNRLEFSNSKVKIQNTANDLIQKVEQLGFKTI